jgi:Cytochrome P460
VPVAWDAVAQFAKLHPAASRFMWEEVMTIDRKFTIATVVATVTALTAAVSVRAGGDKIMFPAEYAKGAVYLTLDRPENKQVREYYTSQGAIDAAKKGAPLPAGTVITVVQYAAQLDPQGNPAKDSGGRFIKTNTIQGYTVMEKQAGWGSEYAEAKRNGEWEYQAFRADKTANPNANLDSCFNCHKPQASNDFVYSYDKMKVASR